MDNSSGVEYGRGTGERILGETMFRRRRKPINKDDAIPLKINDEE
jgi:hypothetical protein